MKILTLIRHAKSSWDHPELDDFDRPLNKRGLRDVPEMANRLASASYIPDRVVSSPARRALTTATDISKKLGIEADEIVRDKRVYHASAGMLADVVRETDDSVNHLMLFGHNPGFTDFANRLSDARIDNLPTSGIYSVRFDTDSWRNFDQDAGVFIFFDYPKNADSTVPRKTGKGMDKGAGK